MRTSTDRLVRSKFVQLTIDWLHFAGHQYHDARIVMVGVCLLNVGLRSRKNIEISWLVLGNQRRCWKFRLPAETVIYNGQNSVLDKFRSDAKMSVYPCPA